MSDQSLKLEDIGASTFLGSPYVGLDKVERGMVVIGGAPHDSTHTSRFGTRMGPRGIRDGSLAMAERFQSSGASGILDVASGERLALPDSSRLVDVGDYNVYPSDVMKSTEGIAGGVEEVVKRGGFSVCLGGDHYVGYPSCLGYTRAVTELSPRPKIGYIHIDGHLDFRDDTPVWGKYNHGTNARRISELDLVSPSNMVWIGIQGWSDEEPVSAIDTGGGLIFTAADVLRIGPEEVARQAGERASAGCDYIYMSVDIDFIDTGFFPATGSVVNDAITPDIMATILRILSSYPIGAMDFVEVAPRIDPSGRSMIMSTDLLLAHVAPRIFDVTPAVG